MNLPLILVTKNIILFGAGASFGSNDVIPYAPPLGGQLYNELRSRFRGTWGSLPSGLDQLFSNSFEDGMKSIWDSNNLSQNIAILMKNMGYYFSEFHIRKPTNNLYFHFIKELNDVIQNILFSTLNYDLLFELAANLNGLSADYWGEKYESSEQIILWKLHGSCNIRSDGFRLDSGVHFTSGVTFESPLRAMNQIETREYCTSSEGLYPAMCLYMKTKPIQIGYREFKNRQQMWGTRVLTADKILVIGVKPYLDDKYIWDPLTKSKAEIGYVGNGSEYDQWIRSGRNEKNTVKLGERWDKCLHKTVSFIS